MISNFFDNVKKEIKLPYEYGNEVNVEFHKLTTENHKLVKRFKCGNKNIDSFVRHQSLKDKETVSYFATDKERNVVIAVISINCTGILMRKPNKRKNYQYMVSAIEVKYFAVNNDYKHLKYSNDAHDYTLSHQIFMHYINDIINITNDVCGATKIVLYSVPQAHSFYKRCKFKDFENYMEKDEQPYLKGCKPMFLSLN